MYENLAMIGKFEKTCLSLLAREQSKSITFLFLQHFLLSLSLCSGSLTFDYIALENFVLRLSKSDYLIPELLGSPPGENVPDQIHRINLSISVFILSYAVFLIVISYLRGAVLQFKALGCAILIPLFVGPFYLLLL